MGLSTVSEGLTPLLRWARCLFRAQVRELSCTSIRARKSLTLARQVLGAASEAQISFAVRWPLGKPILSRRVRAQLSACAEAGSDGGVPLADAAWRLEQWTFGRTTRACVRLPMQAVAGYRAIQLEVIDGRGRALSRHDIEVLGEAQAQELRLQRLKAACQQLWIQSGQHRHRGSLVADASDFVAPEFTIPASDLGAALPACWTEVAWSLVAGKRRTPLERRPILLAGDALTVRATPICLRDRGLFPHAGSYCVVGAIAGRAVAAFPFRLVGRREWLEQVKVSRVELAAQTINRHLRLERGALRWGTHVAFRPIVRIETSIPVPNCPVRFTARLSRGERVLRTEEHSLCLRRSSQCVWLRRFAILDLGAKVRAKPVRLTLSVQVNDERKITWPIIVLPAEHLTNSEGQLKCSLAELSLDEDAYNEIVTRLESAQATRTGSGGPGPYTVVP
ncbi:MAG TPA: hypothetical protein VMU04_08525 [Candidatus Acidoferrum sp.]|nr:hypothetical protein [Candidatus Acidoferrum sp.]